MSLLQNQEAIFQQNILPFTLPEREENRITEFVCGEYDQDSLFSMLMPMVAAMSFNLDNRWLSWVGPFSLNKASAKRFGLHRHHIQQLTPRKHCDAFELTRKALASGTSQFVIGCHYDELTQQQLDALELAAKQGNSKGMVVRFRKRH